MLPQLKQEVAINAVSATNGATITSSNIDLIGASFATIDVIATTQDTTSDNPTVFKIQECDTTVASSFADVTTFVGGTATSTSVGWVIPNGVTSGNNQYKFNIDCRARKRYLRMLISPVTTQTFSAIANLGRNEQGPYTASKANVLSLVEG